MDKCIKNIRNLYKNVKIILILDEISDGLEDYDNIIFIKSENQNMSAKRNLGVKNANTEYVAFIDSDAYPRENWLEIGVDFLNNNLDYIGVTGCQYSPPDDSFSQKCLRLVRFCPLFCHKEWFSIIDNTISEYNCEKFMTSNVLLRKNFYILSGGMDENIYLSEDDEYSERLTKNGYKTRFIPDFSVYHRESKFWAFMRKGYCITHYYSNMLIKGKSVKPLYQMIIQLLPLICTIIYFAVFFVLIINKINPCLLLILPMIVFLLFIKVAIETAKKLENNRIKGFFIILLTFCVFTIVWLIGTLFGLLNINFLNAEQGYRH